MHNDAIDTYEDILGPYSNISPEKPIDSSLIHNIWQFNYDPDDHYLKDIISGRQKQNAYRKFQKYSSNPYGHLPTNNQISQRQYGLTQRLQKIQGSQQEYQKIKFQRSIQKDVQYNNMSRSMKENGMLLANLAKVCQKDQQIECNNKYSIGKMESKRQTTVSPQIYSQKLNLCQIQDSQRLICNNRSVQIYSHKYVSNINLLLRQTRELIQLTEIQTLQTELEQYRMKVMKKQIECRKLRISLRNSNSVNSLMKAKSKKSPQNNKLQINIKLHKHKSQNELKKVYVASSKSSKKGIFIRQPSGRSPSGRSPSYKKSKKQVYLSELINSQKQKFIRLSAKQALVSNRYRYLKNKIQQKSSKKSLQAQQLFCNDQQQIKSLKNIKQNTQSQIIKSLPTGQTLETVQILLQKKKSIKNSLHTSAKYIKNKLSHLNAEISILRKQMSIIDRKIHGTTAIRHNTNILISKSNKKHIKNRFSLQNQVQISRTHFNHKNYKMKSNYEIHSVGRIQCTNMINSINYVAQQPNETLYEPKSDEFIQSVPFKVEYFGNRQNQYSVQDQKTQNI